MPSVSEETWKRPVKPVRVTPETKVLPAPPARIPALAVFEWVAKPDGSYVPRQRIEEAYMRLSEVEKLPLGLTKEVIVKLYRAGFIDGHCAAPNSTMINVISLLEHVEKTRDDPYFWTEKRIAQYRGANDWIVNRARPEPEPTQPDPQS